MSAYVGFVGCPRVGLLVVRVSAAERRMMRVACPRCNVIHETGDPMIRPALAGDEALLIEEGATMTLDDAVERRMQPKTR